MAANAIGSSDPTQGKRRLAGDTARAATTDEVKDLRREARDHRDRPAKALWRMDGGRCYAAGAA